MRDCMMTSFACLFVLWKEKTRREKRNNPIYQVYTHIMCFCKTCACNRMTIRHCHLWYVLCCAVLFCAVLCCCQVRKHETHTNSYNEIRLKSVIACTLQVKCERLFLSMWSIYIVNNIKYKCGACLLICQHCTERTKRAHTLTHTQNQYNWRSKRVARGNENILAWNVEYSATIVKLPDMFICRFFSSHFLLFFCKFFFLLFFKFCSLIFLLYYIYFWVLIYSAWHDNPVIIILQIEYGNNNNVCDWWNVCSCASLLIDIIR